MKKTMPVLALTLVLLGGCKKDDDNQTTPTADSGAPVIALTGNTDETISLNSTYTDQGATAQDNVDGNISSSIVVSGDLNVNLVGDYRKYYNVKDAAGNNAAQMTRYIHVKNDADYMIGTFVVSGNCNSSPTSNPSYNTNVSTSNSVNNRIIFSTVGSNATGLNIYGDINASNINFPQQTGNGHHFSGSGVLSSSKTSFTLNSNSSTPLGTYGCALIHNKL